MSYFEGQLTSKFDLFPIRLEQKASLHQRKSPKLSVMFGGRWKNQICSTLKSVPSTEYHNWDFSQRHHLIS